MKVNAKFHLILFIVLALAASGLFAPMAEAANDVTSPEEFFGFQMGADRKIARWDKIVEYYKLLETQSDKIQVVDMGPSTEGNPFLLVIISSARNLSNLDRLREVNKKISDPRGLAKSEVEKLIGEGKAVICQSMSLHATEIGGTQMAPEMTYELLTQTDETTKIVLDNVIYLMVPCFNPDGQIMVTDFYNKFLGTEYEGGYMPWLYHKYVGHDNNRDAFMTNMVESQYMAKIMFRDWVPQAYLDHHHMGQYGPRFYVPPYSEPIHPNGDPLIWREHSWLGAHMAYKLEQEGKTGILNGGMFLGWGHMGFHWLTIYHNIAGMLTESASAQMATPMYVHPEQLEVSGGSTMRGYAHNAPQTNFPHPWPGGWWRLRDIVEQKKIAAWSLLETAGRNRETVLRNAYLKASRQTERGATGNPAAYVIPTEQHDTLTAVKMVNKLLVQGLEIRQATKAFTTNGMTYPAGSYMVSLAQPKRGVAMNLLGRTLYPENPWTIDANGNPSRPQDTATDTMYEFMGVRVDPIKEVPKGDFDTLSGTIEPAGEVNGSARNGYVLDGRLNASFKAVNQLLAKGVAVRRADKAGQGVRPGDFLVASGSADVLQDVAKQTGVDFSGLQAEPGEAHELKQQRIGMYQRYYGGNMDEGWTRFILEQFDFPYTTLMDEPIKKGGLNTDFDVIIIPNDMTAMIMGGVTEIYPGFPMPEFPPEYKSGLGQEGVEALKAFVEGGGTLVAMGESSEFAIEKLGLSVRNPLKGKPPKEFWCPGSTLRVKFDNTHPLAYGMPDEGLVFLWSNLAFEVQGSDHNDRYATMVRYKDEDILQSGWLKGEDLIAKRSAMIEAQQGKGRAVLIGFRTQHRAQTHGTFKLLFNALMN